ncbi:hypothetical protein [Nocardia sp. alder85J]|uniref:hypothetical protein n=1 Tax=Nocardia sp. alder85J TaxID=2862949 RepID=UPI001CD34C5A|nr:hypothetical protein [Nocardia sp. alder85J]MCX4090973.1 hypothetical protein [Nocardia sp. alder85J]
MRDVVNAVLSVGVTVVAATGIGATASAGEPVAQPDSSCAWNAEVSPRTIEQVNVALPDTGAWYWIMPYQVRPGTTITVTGRFPQARYMSFNTYDARFSSFTAGGVASALPDYRIEADPGTNNPWQHPGEGGAYTVTVAATAGGPNTLPLAPDGVRSGNGYLILREYLPAGGAGPVLPEVRISDESGTRTLGSCVGGGGVLGAVSQVLGDAGIGLPGKLSGGQEFRRVSGAGAFPNVDNAYLSATFTPPADGRVMVVRGRAPKAPAGTEPTVWPPGSGTDVRYFSFCTNLAMLPGPVVVNPAADGSADNGCRTDEQTALDAAGDYTFVVGTEAQRAEIEAVPGATFVPMSVAHPATPEVMLVRNMLPAGEFPYAVQQVPVDGTAEQAAGIMGPYYPHATLCAIAAVRDGSCPA